MIVPSKSFLTLRRFVFAALLAVVPLASAAAQGKGTLAQQVAAANGRVIVTLKPSGGGASIMAKGEQPISDLVMNQVSERMGAEYSTQEIQRIPFAGMIVAHTDTAKLQQLLSDPNVAAVEADRLWSPTDLGEAAPPDEWAAYHRADATHDRAGDTVPPGVTQVTAPQVWALGNKGDGVKVGILDSGGDPTHPDLSYAGGYNAINLTSSGWQDTVSVCLGHGTHIAGTIAAKDNGIGVVGVAPHALLYAIRVFQNVGGSCLAYTSSQIYGIQWAVSQGIRLVNVSIGGTFSTAYDAAIQSAAAQGTYVIAAAGNNGGALTYPGSSDYAIGVGAVDNSNVRQSWSDFGSQLDIMAPGLNVYSTLPGGNYGTKSGTSMATPHVVGVAALLLAADPSLTFDQLRQELIDGALDLGDPGYDAVLRLRPGARLQLAGRWRHCADPGGEPVVAEHLGGAGRHGGRRQRHGDAERHQRVEHGLDRDQQEELDDAHHVERHRQRDGGVEPQRQRPCGRHLRGHHHGERVGGDRFAGAGDRHPQGDGADAAGAGGEPVVAERHGPCRAVRLRVTTPR